MTVSSLIRRKKRRPFSISLIEDNQFYLQGIVNYIRDSIPNIKLNAFTRSSSFLTSLRHNPEIAIVDFNLDERSEIEGIELIRELKLKSPKTKIIVLSGEKSISTAVKCLNEGVLDYVIKGDKAIDKIAEEIKLLMKDMLKEIEKESLQKTIHFIIGTACIITITLLAINSLNPKLLE